MKQASLFPNLSKGFPHGTLVEIPSLEILAQLLREQKMKENYVMMHFTIMQINKF
jgi:hypothetical protein